MGERGAGRAELGAEAEADHGPPLGVRGRGRDDLLPLAPLVLAIGNGDRGDDAAGLVAGRLLRERLPSGVRIIEHTGEATSLLDALRSARHVWLIDAAQSDKAPGTVHRIDCAVTDAVLPRDTMSSHGFGVAEAIGLARALCMLPPHCIVYAIEAVDFTTGASPSRAVLRAAREVADRIAGELAALG